MQSNEFLSEERARGECYRLLAACFYPPRKVLWLEEDLPGNLTSLLSRICPPAAESARRMAEALSRCGAEELAVEYARLFVGPQRVIAPPYGSVYLEEGRRVMGDSTLEVLRAYQEAGLHLDSEFKELPDHIAAELEFMYYLTAKGVDAASQGEAREAAGRLAAREAFLNRHLRRWVPGFCARVKDEAGSDFYGSLADCVAGFIELAPAPPGLGGGAAQPDP